MNRNSIFIFLSINILFSFSSCLGNDDNEFIEEPYLLCQISSSTNYDSVYGLDKSDRINPESLGSNNFSLPLNMNSDTVVYIFEENSIPIDTLTISYQVELNPYGPTGCSSPDSFTVSVYSEQIVESQTTFNPDEIHLYFEN